MPLRVVYSASLVPCRDEAVEAVLRRHVDFKLEDRFRIVVPDLESRLDLERALLADPRLGEVLIGKSLLTWSALIQGLLRELPAALPLPSLALQRRALRLALEENHFDWKLDLDSERRLIWELNQLLRQHGPGPAFTPGALLAQAWRRRLAGHFRAWTAEEAAERVWSSFPSRAWRELSSPSEIFILGFRSPEPNLLQGIWALQRKYPDTRLHLYLPPRDSLVGEDGLWLAWRNALEESAETWSEWPASALPAPTLLAFPTAVHEAGKILESSLGLQNQLLLPSNGELTEHLEARYLAETGILPALGAGHAALSADLLSALGRDLPEGESQLGEFLADKEKIFADRQIRLAKAGDWEGLRLLEAFLQKLKELLAAQSIEPERRTPIQWMAEIRDDWLSLRLASSISLKQLPWRRLDRAGLGSPASLWIAGLQDGALPSGHGAAFFEEERPFALAALEERLAFDQALRSGAEALTFSYSEFSLDGRPNMPSPWLDNLAKAQNAVVVSDLAMRPSSRSPFWEENLRRESARRRPPLGVDSGNLSGLGLESLLRQQMSSQALSPTYLDNLAKCAWSFFARRYLKLTREAEEDLEINPRRRGSLQHRLLEAAFADLIEDHFSGGRRPSLAEVDASLERVYSALAAKTMEEASPIPPVLLQDQLERIREVARSLLNEEHSGWLEAKQALIPRHLEWSFGRGAAPHLEIEVDAGFSLPLKGQIDRIDASEDGRYFLLIDYKSSGSGGFAADLRDGLSLQLWIYLQAVSRGLLPDAEPLGALYWDLKERSRNQGMARRELYKDFTHRNNFANSRSIMKEEEYAKLNQRLEERLRSLLKRALRGDYSLEPDKCSGRYCDYFEICRYGNKPRN